MSYEPNSKETMELIQKLVSIPSPSGNTEKVIEFVEDFSKNLGVDTCRNRKGGLIATLKGKNNTKHRMLTAHVDTLGAMVKEIKSNGRLRLDLIGGFAWNSIEGNIAKLKQLPEKFIPGRF